MKNILKNNEAISALQTLSNEDKLCGYFVADDYEGTVHYDKGTIIAFDNTGEHYFENDFATIQEAIDWINQ